MNIPKKNIKTVDIIRHGEPVGGRKYRGQTDDPLSEKGWQQMWDAVGEYRKWDAIVTSPLLRCAEFAQALGQKLALPVTADDRFKECQFGVWEGKYPEEICQHDADLLQKFKADPVQYEPVGAEPLPEFYARVQAGWQDLLTLHQGQHVLLVGHAGMMRMIIAHVLEIPLNHVYQIQVSNAAVTRIEITHQQDGFFQSLIFHDGRL